ncbi:hypothetical protein GQ600_3708 [Phytophthora cactorum]|nr:hypothetical protein GQ600_3708 [Phytophthora cactorum]
MGHTRCRGGERAPRIYVTSIYLSYRLILLQYWAVAKKELRHLASPKVSMILDKWKTRVTEDDWIRGLQSQAPERM